MKKILFLLLMVSFVKAAILTVGSGGTYATIPLAIAAGANGDTIQTVSNITATAQCDLKLRMLLRSAPGRYDTVFADATFDLIHAAADSTRLHNIAIGWTATAASGTHYLRSSESTSAGRGGFVDSNVTYFNAGSVEAGKRLYNINKPSSTYAYEHAKIFGCKFYNLGGSAWNITTADTSLQPNYSLSYCEFYNTALVIPHHSICEYNIVNFAGQNTLCGGDSSIVRYNYFNAQGNSTGEIVSLDEARRAYYWQFYGNTYDSASHVKLSIDGAHHTVVYNERFDTTLLATSYDIYGHNSDQYDTSSDLVIRNIYMKNGFNIAASGTQDWKKTRIKNSIFLGGCDISVANSVDDTLSKLLWLGTKGTISGDPYQVDTLSGDTNAVINRNHYPFIKQKANNDAIMTGDTLGPLKYLTNYQSLIDTTETGFSAVCSLSTEFYWNNPVIKDSATIRMFVKQGAGAWTQVDSSVNINAGQKDTLVYASGSSGTAYDFMFITTGATSESVIDTTFSYSITTQGGAGFDSTVYFQWDGSNPADSSWYNATRTNTTFPTVDGRQCMKIQCLTTDGEILTGLDVDPLPLGTLTNGETIFYRFWMKLSSDWQWSASNSAMKASRVVYSPVRDPNVRVYTGFFDSDKMFIHETDDDLVPTKYYSPGGPVIEGNFDSIAKSGWHEYIVKFKYQSSPASSDAGFSLYIDGDSIGETPYTFQLVDSAGWFDESWRGWFVSQVFSASEIGSDTGGFYIRDVSTTNYFYSTYTPPFDSIVYFEHDMDDLNHPQINGFALDNTYTTFDSTIKHSGVASMKVHAIGNDGGNQQTGLDFDQIPFGTLDSSKILCHQAWVRFASDFSFGSGSPCYTKIGRISDWPVTNQFFTLLLRKDGVVIGEDGHLSPIPPWYASNGVQTLFPFDTINDDTWHEVTIAYQFESSTSASDGTFRLYIDSILVDSVGNINYDSLAIDASFLWGGIFGGPYFQLNGTASDGGDLWVDDIKTSNYMLPMTAFSETPAAPPVITAQPHDTSVVENTTASFSVAAANATGYQWYGNGSLISGATNSTYSFTATIDLSGSSIWCIVSNADTSISSDTVTLTVTEYITPPIILQSIDTLKLNAKHFGTTQWLQNGSSIGSGSNVSLNADSAFYAGTKIEAVTGSKKSTWLFKSSGNKRSINFK